MNLSEAVRESVGEMCPNPAPATGSFKLEFCLRAENQQFTLLAGSQGPARSFLSLFGIVALENERKRRKPPSSSRFSTSSPLKCRRIARNDKCPYGGGKK
jgi:hypothetical protein